jgi:hypothetical protein
MGSGLGGARESARNTEGIFPFLVNFWAIFRFSVIFGTLFSHFCHFWDSERRYTRAQDATLYYCPSQNRFEAGRPSAPAVENSFWEHLRI